jgi:hypothetical protein
MVSRKLTGLAVLVMLGTATACSHHHHSRHDGPVERAGEHVDDAADTAGDAIEGAGRTINRALPGD